MLQFKQSEGEMSDALWVGFKGYLPIRIAAGQGQSDCLSLGWFWK